MFRLVVQPYLPFVHPLSAFPFLLIPFSSFSPKFCLPPLRMTVPFTRGAFFLVIVLFDSITVFPTRFCSYFSASFLPPYPGEPQARPFPLDFLATSFSFCRLRTLPDFSTSLLGSLLEYRQDYTQELKGVSLYTYPPGLRPILPLTFPWRPSPKKTGKPLFTSFSVFSGFGFWSRSPGDLFCGERRSLVLPLNLCPSGLLVWQYRSPKVFGPSHLFSSSTTSLNSPFLQVASIFFLPAFFAS